MSEGSEPGPPPVYGGRRRTRGLLSRTPTEQPVDEAYPTVPDAVRYFRNTGQIPVVDGDAGGERDGGDNGSGAGSGRGSDGIVIGAGDRGGSEPGSLIPEDTSPRSEVLAPPRITISGAHLAAQPEAAPHASEARASAPQASAPRASAPHAPSASAPDTWRLPAADAPPASAATAMPATSTATATATATAVITPLQDAPRVEREPTAIPAAGPVTAPVSATPPEPSLWRRLLTAPATWLGLAAVGICLVAANIPAFSLYEAVTIEAARRDWAGMWALVASGHASQAVWVWITHLWIGAFGTSELSLRFLPALAAGATVAGITLLTTRLAGPRAGLLTGVIAALLPRLTLQGSEASGIALGTALATWATVALVRTVGKTDPIPHFDVPKQLISHRNRARRRQAIWRHIGRWSLVALLLTLAAWVFLPTIALALVHPLFVMVAGARRGALRGSALASLGALVCTAPLIVMVAMQDWWMLGRARETPMGPIAWITEPSMTDAVVAVPVTIMAAVMLAVGIARIRHVIARTGTTGLALAVTWIAVPTAVVALQQALVPQAISADLLSFTAPAVAMLLGIALTAGPTWLWITLLVILLQALVPPLLFQKFPTARGGSDDRATAQYIGGRAGDGDGIVFAVGADEADDAARAEGATPGSRTMLSTYPEPLAGLDDLELAQSGADAGTLWDATVDIATVPGRLDAVDRVWVLRPVSAPMTTKTPEFAIYGDRGFAVVSSAVFAEYIVYELVRTDAFGLDDEGKPPAPDPLPPLPSPVPTNYDDVEE